MRKKLLAGAALLTLMAGLCGCQKTPEESIVKNKDMDELIEQAGSSPSDAADLADMAETYDTYVNSFSDDAMHVNVNVDAKVDIPKTSQMSVFRVQQKSIDQGYIDKAISAFMPGETLYDGCVTSLRTKADYEGEIESFNQAIAELEANPNEDSDIVIAEDTEYRNRLIDECANAPETVNIADYPSDGQLMNAGAKSQAMNNEFYDWVYELNPNGDVLYAVNDGSDGYKSLYVQNNENYGNCLRFVKRNTYYSFNASAYVDAGSCFSDYIDYYWRIADGVPSEYQEFYSKDKVTETANLSAEDAKAAADGVLAELGITDFTLYQSDKFMERMDIRGGKWDQENYFREEYIFQYIRNIDGAFMTYGNSNKYTEGWSEDTYVKKIWGSESIVIAVNDEGVVSFEISSPLEITDTVVDKSNIKDFEEIKDIFEQMIVVTNAQEDEGDTSVDITIDRVILGYARISEEDSFDTGLIVPVWDFIGTVNDKYGDVGKSESSGSIMTINAIDGTIIDRALGY